MYKMYGCDQSQFPDKIHIELFGLHEAALIIKYPSGIIYQNQVRGLSVYQACVEGVLGPLSPKSWACNSDSDDTLQQQISHFFAMPGHSGPGYLLSKMAEGLNRGILDKIDDILCNWHEVGMMKVDRELLEESCEAWIHVVIEAVEGKDKSEYVWSGFGERPWKGILTWWNSD